MSNIHFKVESFTDIKAMFDYGLLFKTMTTSVEDDKFVHYIGLKTPQDIERFLSEARICQGELFRSIAVLSKVLYYCNRKELKSDEVDTILALFIALSEMGVSIADGTQYMTVDNTFPIKMDEIISETI